MEETATALPWLEPLLSTAFFSVCPTPAHRDSPKCRTNMYCLDCNDNAFCFRCRSRHHDHRTILIRKSSDRDVVKVPDIENLLETSGIQTHVLNSATVIYLKESPEPKNSTKTKHVCEICESSILSPLSFCSLRCKLVAVKRRIRNETFILNGKNDKEVGSSER